MKQYLDLLQAILERGNKRNDRTGTGTLSLFGYQMRFDLREGFPLLTTKKLSTRAIVYELLWFLSGSTNVFDLQKHGVRIWNEWAREDGRLGPIYGHQWRSFGKRLMYILEPKRADQERGYVEEPGIDQISNVIEQIKTNPHSRRLVVTAWNPMQMGVIPACHAMFQFYVCDGELSCQLYQRSGDVFLGVPFNIASYALLTHMVAQVCGLKVGEFIHTFGDVHLYLNHVEQAKEQLRREPRELPKLWLNPNVTDIFEFQYVDIEFHDYNPHPAIKAEVSV